MHSRFWVGLCAVILASLVGFWLYATLTDPNLLPSADAGQWLAFSRYYSGQPWPPYRQPLSVPPLFPVLLAVFARHPGRVLSRDFLLEQTRGREAGPFDRTIDVQVGRLRRKLDDDAAEPRLLKSVRGAGYVLVAGNA